PQRQRGYRRKGERWTLREHPQRVLQVFDERFNHRIISLVCSISGNDGRIRTPAQAGGEREVRRRYALFCWGFSPRGAVSVGAHREPGTSQVARFMPMTKGRVEAFSDGVIAILITIMVLELKVPEHTDLEALRPLVPVILSYVLSFVFLGIYWNNHHHMFHLVKHVTGGMLWANLHL